MLHGLALWLWRITENRVLVSNFADILASHLTEIADLFCETEETVRLSASSSKLIRTPLATSVVGTSFLEGDRLESSSSL
jgi:hypothetical protein